MSSELYWTMESKDEYFSMAHKKGRQFYLTDGPVLQNLKADAFIALMH